LFVRSKATGQYCFNAVDQYVDTAWDINQDVPGARSAQTGKLKFIIQSIIMHKASEKYFGGDGSRQRAIKDLMDDWEAIYDRVLNGDGAGRRLNSATEVKATTEGEHLSSLEDMLTSWTSFKAAIQAATGVGSGGIVEALRNVTAKATAVSKKSEATNELFSTMVKTTTKTPINLMLPLPLTGVWAPGATMKMATELAIEIINADQEMMPGYNFIADFFDDQCDPDRAMRDMLEKFAASQDWVGVGGLGCASVCESLAVISASLFLPLVSFECSDGSELSKNDLFPDFVRLGTTRSGLAAIVGSISTAKDWFSTVRIVAGDSYAELMLDVSSSMTAFWENQRMEGAELPSGQVVSRLSVVESQMDTDFSTAQTIFAEVSANKERLILLLGSEGQLRQAVCASQANEVGLAWVIDGVRAKNWWLQEDAVLAGSPETEACNADLLTSLLQGSVSVMGLGRPLHQGISMLDPSMPAPVEEHMECYQGRTPSALNAYVKAELARGPSELEPNRTAVAHPHEELINFALDGVCIFAKTMKEFVFRRKTTIEQMRERDQRRFNQITGYIKDSMTFEGASGTVDIDGNDLPASLGAWQLQGNKTELVGIYGSDGVLNFSWATGLQNASWQPPRADAVAAEEESFPVLAVVIPILACFFCAIVCYAVYSGRGAVSKSSNKA